MPHVILSGTPDLQTFFNQFKPYRSDSNGWIIKIDNCLINADKTMLLFDCTAVRSGFSQDFYIRAEKKELRVTIRVEPYCRIERNEGVQRSIVAIAASLRDIYADLTLSKSNLPDEVLRDGKLV